jgi:hypothetical protein
MAHILHNTSATKTGLQVGGDIHESTPVRNVEPNFFAIGFYIFLNITLMFSYQS